MLNNPGYITLLVALILALIQTGLPFLAHRMGEPAAVRSARQTAKTQFLVLLLSFICLIYGFVSSDFSLLIVAENSHSTKPLLYKFAGTWGNHEGSLLLWLLMIAFFGALVAQFAKSLPSKFVLHVLAVQGSIGLAFLLFSLLTSNPFAKLNPVPPNGLGLNPLLQDPGLAFHPPFLYAGYVGFSLAFSFSVAALIQGKIDKEWAMWLRPWTLLAWSLLTLGIAMGAWWAYYELGWGGFWYWDPVENASLMPWLAGTILLHCLAVVEKRGALRSWAILMSIIAFVASLLGTFLVRSGLLTSVHAFANDPYRGQFLLLLCAFFTAASLILYASRANKLKPQEEFHGFSRETILMINNVFVLAILATIFFGVFWPTLSHILFGIEVTVGPPYYHQTVVPLTGIAALVMGLAFSLSWKRANLRSAINLSILPFVFALLTGLACLVLAPQKPISSMLWIFLCCWVAFSSLFALTKEVGLLRVKPKLSLVNPFVTLKLGVLRKPNLRNTASAISHLGFAFCCLGITGASYWKQEYYAYVEVGTQIEFAGYDFTMTDLQRTEGKNYGVDRAIFSVSKNGRLLGALEPERRYYPVSRADTTESAIRRAFLTDLYLTIAPGRKDKPKERVLRATYHPLVSLIWLGVLVMAVGGLIAVIESNLRRVTLKRKNKT